MGKFNNINNKKIKITYNNLDNHADIDFIFGEMDKVFSKFDMDVSSFNTYAEHMFGGKPNIKVQIIDNNQKKEPTNLSFKKWINWLKS